MAITEMIVIFISFRVCASLGYTHITCQHPLAGQSINGGSPISRRQEGMSGG